MVLFMQDIWVSFAHIFFPVDPTIHYGPCMLNGLWKNGKL